MWKFKRAALVLAMGGVLMAQVQADELSVSNMRDQSGGIFLQNDVDKIFDGNDDVLQLAVLSEQEMKDTEGAYYWLYFYAPQITAASMWMYNSGWRTIPGWYHNIRQRW